MPKPHDQNYKRLFSHKDVIRDLLIAYIAVEWTDGSLDYESLEPHKDSHVGDDLSERRNDAIWRIRWQPADHNLEARWMYLYLMLEFQSTVDPMMAVRIQVYSGLLWQQLVASKQATTDALPLVVPIILYNGNAEWTAKVNVREMIAAGFPSVLLPYVPSVQYVYLSETRMQVSESEAIRNLASLIFKFEQCRKAEEVADLLAKVEVWFADPERAGLEKDFGTWIGTSVLKKINNSKKILENEAGLRKVSGMLAENMEMWKTALIEEGEARGEALGEARERINGILRNVRRDLISIDQARVEIIELQTAGAVPEALAADALAQLG